MARRHAWSQAALWAWSLIVTQGALLAVASAAVGEDVIGWRGDGSGRFPAAKPPKSWSKQQNILWKAELPGGGYASPVVVGEKLLLAAEPSQMVCLSTVNGSILWRKTAGYAEALGAKQAAEIDATYARFEEELRPLRKESETLRKADPKALKLESLNASIKVIQDRKKEYSDRFPQERGGGAGNAAATPACDGRGVYALFGTGIVAAFDMQGTVRWARHLDVSQLGFGHSASPVLAGGQVIVHIRDLIALDPETGREVWRAKLPPKHGTAAVAKIAGEDAVITPSGGVVRARDGLVLAKQLFDLSENSPLVHEGIVYAHESGKVKAYRLPDNWDGAATPVLMWEGSSTREQRMATAALADGLLYAATRSGILDVTDAATGKSVFRKRLELGELFSSITVAGNLVYLSGKDGKTALVRPGQEYDEVKVNQLDRTSSTPVFVGERIYLGRAPVVLHRPVMQSLSLRVARCRPQGHRTACAVPLLGKKIAA